VACGSAGTRTKDGRLWFPTQDGVAIVDPRTVTARRVTPPAVIERVVAGDTGLAVGGEAVTVGVHQRDLAIEYTALSLLEPKNLRFRYRLEPYDADWVDAGNRRVAFYTKVPPGNYTFRVQASSPGGEWSSSGGTLPLSLAFQPWETRTFRFGGALFLLVAVSGFAVFWSRRARRRAQELEFVVAERTAALREREQQLARQNVQLSELDRAKSRFFANVSHEFRTPLTLTIGPLEGAMDKLKGVDGSVARAFDMALRNARRLMRLVNQILDVAKLEAGQMRLNRRTLDLAPFVRSIAEAFAPAAEAKGVVLDVVAPSSLRCAFDSDALEKVVTNLVSNALKFTPGGGCVTITLREQSDAVMLRVSDTGPGIPAEHLAHVFERFYQVDETLTRAEAGTASGWRWCRNW
jgi:signal transduction histidine kinase